MEEANDLRFTDDLKVDFEGPVKDVEHHLSKHAGTHAHPTNDLNPFITFSKNSIHSSNTYAFFETIDRNDKSLKFG